MGKLNLILLSLFAILLHANLSSNEKCLQQLWEEILIEEKEPDAMCGLNDEQSVKRNYLIIKNVFLLFYI